MKKFIFILMIFAIAFGAVGSAFSAPVSEKDKYVGDILQLIDKTEYDYMQDVGEEEEEQEEYSKILEEDISKLREKVYKYGWYLVELGEYNSEVMNIVYYVQLAIHGQESAKNFGIARAILDTNYAYIMLNRNSKHS